MKFLHKLPTPQKLWVQILSSSLTIEIGLLLVSAGQRINLYQAAHGLTRARIFGFIFLIWLGFMLALFLVRITQNLKSKILFTFFMIPTIGVLLFINLVNIDGLIATKYKPSVNNEVDYYYLVNLSEDGSASWQAAVLDTQATLLRLEPSKSFSAEQYRQIYWTRLTLERLDNMINFLNNKYGDYSKIRMEHEAARKNIARLRKWQSFSFGEYEAFKIIEKDNYFYSQVNVLLQKASDFDSSRVNDDVRQSSPLDRAAQPPLL